MIHAMEDRKEKKSSRKGRIKGGEGKKEEEGRGQGLKMILCAPAWKKLLERRLAVERYCVRLGLSQRLCRSRAASNPAGCSPDVIWEAPVPESLPNWSLYLEFHHERLSLLGSFFGHDTGPTKCSKNLSHDQLMFLDGILLDLFQALAISWGTYTY